MSSALAHSWAHAEPIGQSRAGEDDELMDPRHWTSNDGPHTQRRRTREEKKTSDLAFHGFACAPPPKIWTQLSDDLHH